MIFYCISEFKLSRKEYQKEILECRLKAFPDFIGRQRLELCRSFLATGPFKEIAFRLHSWLDAKTYAVPRGKRYIFHPLLIHYEWWCCCNFCLFRVQPARNRHFAIFCTWITSMIVELIKGSLMLGYMGFALAMSIILIGITLERYMEPQPPPKLQKFSRKSEKME